MLVHAPALRCSHNLFVCSVAPQAQTTAPAALVAVVVPAAPPAPPKAVAAPVAVVPAPAPQAAPTPQPAVAAPAELQSYEISPYKSGSDRCECLSSGDAPHAPSS